MPDAGRDIERLRAEHRDDLQMFRAVLDEHDSAAQRFGQFAVNVVSAPRLLKLEPTCTVLVVSSVPSIVRLPPPAKVFVSRVSVPVLPKSPVTVSDAVPTSASTLLALMVRLWIVAAWFRVTLPLVVSPIVTSESWSGTPALHLGASSQLPVAS